MQSKHVPPACNQNLREMKDVEKHGRPRGADLFIHLKPCWTECYFWWDGETRIDLQLGESILSAAFYFRTEMSYIIRARWHATTSENELRSFEEFSITPGDYLHDWRDEIKSRAWRKKKKRVRADESRSFEWGEWFGVKGNHPDDRV